MGRSVPAPRVAFGSSFPGKTRLNDRRSHRYSALATIATCTDETPYTDRVLFAM